MPGDTDDRSQRKKFEDLAKELADETGEAPSLDDMNALVGTVGRAAPQTEAEAREEAGKKPR